VRQGKRARRTAARRDRVLKQVPLENAQPVSQLDLHPRPRHRPAPQQRQQQVRARPQQ
jgi:hypothetical protein